MAANSLRCLMLHDQTPQAGTALLPLPLMSEATAQCQPSTVRLARHNDKVSADATVTHAR